MSAPAPRIILHAGFHKTGTTSAQAYLTTHQHRIPGLAVYITKDFKELNDRAWGYGARPYLPQRLRFRGALSAFMRQLPDCETLVISCENLAGVPPGFRRAGSGFVGSYLKAGRPLLHDTIKALRARFDGCHITLAFSLRARDSWLASTYAQLLSSYRLTDDFGRFKARFAPDFDLTDEARTLSDALTADAVLTYSMEDSAETKQGPATPLLQLIGLSATEISALPVAAQRNRRRPSELQAALLEANRTIKGRRALAAAKRSLLAG